MSYKKSERASRRPDIMAKLGTTTYNFDTHEYAHIEVEGEICKGCDHQMCIWGCPADCYVSMPKKKIPVHFNYENCVECGTCFVMCDQGAVKWSYPRGTYGVKYKQG